MKVFFLQLGSFLAALALTITPLPPAIAMWQPDYLVILCLLWFIYGLRKLSFSLIFVIGLCHDMLTGSLLGSHSAALLVVFFLCLKLARQLRYLSMWQQMILIFALVLVNQLIIGLSEAVQGYIVSAPVFFSPAISSALLWSVAYLCLYFFRRDDYVL